MIINSMSRKDASFQQLTDYMRNAEGAEIVLRHNLAVGADSPEAMVSDFLMNHTWLPARANGNSLYHEVIALPPGLSVSVKEQKDKLRQIAQRYLDRRAPKQLALGVIHTDTAHVHIHLMISSNALRSRERAWLTKAEFSAIEQEVEAYQVATFPELGAERRFGRKGRDQRHSNAEQALTRRTGKPRQKQEITAVVGAAMKEAKTREALNTALAAQGLTLYRRGRSVGVISKGGRRYRFSTLGLADVYADAEARFELLESRRAMLGREVAKLRSRSLER